MDWAISLWMAKYVINLLVVLPGPEVGVMDCIYQLHGKPDLVFMSLSTSFKDVADIQVLRDLANLFGMIPVGLYRGSGDDPQIFDLA